MNPERLYLGQHFKSRLSDDTEWFQLYGKVKEEIHIDAPAPYGKDVDINSWVNAYHVIYRLTSHRHTVVLVFINLDPIL